MPAESRKTLVVVPEMPFDDIAATLCALGWERASSPVSEAPLLPGEPVLASWSLPGDGARASYSFNPVVRLRVLELEGQDALQLAAQVAGRLPCMDTERVGSLLASQDPRELLLGLYAAVELKAIDLLPDIERLRIHVDQRVSRAAARTSAKLALALLVASAQKLAEERRRRPDRSAVFPRIGDADFRRETLLWMLHDVANPNEEVAKVLRAALADPDWRVRVTAMLVAVRLKVTGVWQEVRYMQIPGTGPKGLDRRRQSLLRAVQKAALRELADEPRDTAKDEGASLMPHLRAVVAGEDDGLRDEAREWIESFLRVPDEAA